MMSLFGDIASSVANLTDNVVGMVNQNHQNKANLHMMREQNAFNAQQAQIQRDWQQQMWGMNNAYNSPSAMISRGLNPFVQGSASMAGSRSPASGGVAATAAPVPSMQAYKPNFSSVFQSLASLAQAKASEASAGNGGYNQENRKHYDQGYSED
jgi:phage tail sheath gpL-like